eukprot:augustus_masked-scaffold_58-processed-gene-0.2-mRNA-1 protein AED:1.00 eAED:1.00 QI:0/-1/0/0/-1/1/1/0/454
MRLLKTIILINSINLIKSNTCNQQNINVFEAHIDNTPYKDIDELRQFLLENNLVQLQNTVHKHDFLNKNIILLPSPDIQGISVEQTPPAYTDPFIPFSISTALSERYFDTEVKLICLRKGTPVKSIPYYYEKGAGYKWFTNECRKVELGLVNFISKDKPLEVFWVSPKGERHFQGNLDYGEPKTLWRQTFIGHQFVVIGKNEVTGESVEEVIDIQSDTFRVIGSKFQETQKNQREDLTEKQKDNVNMYELGRAERVERTFTKDGYYRMAMPKKLWGSIQTFWNNNKDRELNMFEEIWKGRSTYVNWWKEVPLMSVAPFGLKAKWHELLQPVLESWANTCLIPTDLYGIRSYFDGNWLLNHVDRHETHAVSAIINVEQNDIREDWELEVINLNGTVVHSPLFEEEMFLYESAKVMHGRPKPLEGRRYVNVFFHYKPVVDDDVKWWLTPDSVKIEL